MHGSATSTGVWLSSTVSEIGTVVVYGPLWLGKDLSCCCYNAVESVYVTIVSQCVCVQSVVATCRCLPPTCMACGTRPCDELSSLCPSCTDASTWVHLKFSLVMLLSSYARSHMLSASWRPPHLLHVGAAVSRWTWSMDKSWRYVTLFGFHHSHIVHCHFHFPFLAARTAVAMTHSAVTTDAGGGRHLEVGLWCLPLSWNWPP